MKVARLSVLRTGHFYPQKKFLVLISLRGWVDPRATMRPEGLCQWKILMTPSGIDTATFRFVTHCPNHCTTAYPTSHEDQHRFMIISCWVILRTRNISDRISSENQNSNFVFNNSIPSHPTPSEINAVCDIMWKNMTKTGRPLITV
jgi:hypothetical protein